MSEVGLIYLGSPDAMDHLAPEQQARALAVHLARLGYKPGPTQTGNAVIDGFLGRLG